MRLPNQSIRPSLITLMAIAVLAGGIFARGEGAHAQSASPVASPGAAVCDVEPRSEEELGRLAALAATPVAGTPEPGDGSHWIEGTPVDAATMEEIEQTFDLIAACVASGDVARLLALYTDDFIVREVLAAESVPIVPGTPNAAFPVGTPVAGDPPLTIERALQPQDGRVDALVNRDGRREVVVFAEEGDMWRVDAVVAVTGDDGTPEAPDAGELVSLPPVQAAIADAAANAGVPEDEVTVVGVEPTVWPDSSLGCPQPDQFYAQVETPGYIVALDVAGTGVTYHTDEGEAVIPCKADGS